MEGTDGASAEWLCVSSVLEPTDGDGGKRKLAGWETASGLWQIALRV